MNDLKMIIKSLCTLINIINIKSAVEEEVPFLLLFNGQSIFVVEH